MNDTFAKLIAMVIVGNVARSLFGNRQPNPIATTVINRAADAAKHVADAKN